MLQSLIGPVTGLLDKFVEDKDQKNALAHEIATLAEKQAHEAAMAQAATASATPSSNETINQDDDVFGVVLALGLVAVLTVAIISGIESGGP